MRPSCLLLSLVALCAAAPLAAQQVAWRSGLPVYTPAIDFVTGFSPNGTGYYVSQAHIVSPPQPVVEKPEVKEPVVKVEKKPREKKKKKDDAVDPDVGLMKPKFLE